jgi:hypothetical protein
VPIYAANNRTLRMPVASNTDQEEYNPDVYSYSSLQRERSFSENSYSMSWGKSRVLP